MSKLAAMTESSKAAVPLDQALTLTGFGLFNLLLVLTSGGVLVSVIIETMCMMIIIPAAQCDLQLTLTTKGLLSGVSFLGIVLSSYIWGYLADTRGRRKAVMLSLGVSAGTTFLSGFAPWAWLMILLRLINGMFIAGASATVYAFAGEFHDNHFRPKVISWVSTFVALGNMILPGLGWLILEANWSYDLGFITFRPWRLLLIVYAIPSALSVLALYFQPETPKFLLTQEKHGQVMEILRKMYRMNRARGNAEEFSVKEICWENLGDETKSKDKAGVLASMWQQTAPLIRKNLLRKTLIVCFLQFACFASNTGVMMWYPEIINRMSDFMQDNPNSDVSLCHSVLIEEKFTNSNSTQVIIDCKDTVQTDVFLVIMVVSVAYAVAYLFNGFVINVLGKKPLMIGFASMTGIAGICAQYIYGYTLIQLLLGVYVLVGVGIGITNAIAVDTFPTQVRAMAMALSLMCGRIGAMLASNFIGIIIYNLCDYLFIILASLNLGIIIGVLLLPTQKKLPKLVQE